MHLWSRLYNWIAEATVIFGRAGVTPQNNLQLSLLALVGGSLDMFK
jgi:hypothetical protein